MCEKITHVFPNDVMSIIHPSMSSNVHFPYSEVRPSTYASTSAHIHTGSDPESESCVRAAAGIVFLREEASVWSMYMRTLRMSVSEVRQTLETRDENLWRRQMTQRVWS